MEFITEFGGGGVASQPAGQTHQSAPTSSRVTEKPSEDRSRDRRRQRERDRERGGESGRNTQSSRHHSRSPRHQSSHNSRHRESRSRSRSRYMHTHGHQPEGTGLKAYVSRGLLLSMYGRERGRDFSCVSVPVNRDLFSTKIPVSMS